jgi:four helix bundle protein
MSTITRFEDIIAWQKTRLICKEIYAITKTSAFNNDFKLINQMRDSSGSIMDNIAEGFSRGGSKEFFHFCSIAKASLGELQSQLYRSSDQNYFTQEEFNSLYEKTAETGKLLTSLMNYLHSTDIKGIKYKNQPDQN